MEDTPNSKAINGGSTGHFYLLLKELTERCSCPSNNFTDHAWNRATSDLVEKIYLCWEKLYLNGEGEHLASEIAGSKPEFLHALHTFVVSIFSGIFLILFTPVCT